MNRKTAENLLRKAGYQHFSILEQRKSLEIVVQQPLEDELLTLFDSVLLGSKVCKQDCSSVMILSVMRF